MSDDDELPAISVNSSASSSGLFSMPSAAEVAGARDRAAQCERELAQLRAVVTLSHSDSSGSEGEAALAAAVSDLRVAETAPSTFACSVPSILTRALVAAPDPPPTLITRYLAAAAAVTSANLDNHVVAALTAGVPDEEAFGAALWAAAACGAPADPRVRPTLLRLVHSLLERLDAGATEDICVALEEGLMESGAARVEVVDALRGGGPNARRVATRLSTFTPACEIDRYAALQLTGRVPFHDSDAARRLLDSLAPRHPHPTPEQLKMLVAASKIRVLFDIGR